MISIVRQIHPPTWLPPPPRHPTRQANNSNGQWVADQRRPISDVSPRVASWGQDSQRGNYEDMWGKKHEE